MLYALGPVVFSIAPLNTDKVQRTGETKHAEHHVLGGAPLYEFMGEGKRTIKLKGAVFPDNFGGLDQLGALEQMRRLGAPQHLLRGDGTPMGWVVIEDVNEDHEHLNPQGVGRVISYTIDMKVAGAPGAGAFIDIVGGFLR